MHGATQVLMHLDNVFLDRKRILLGFEGENDGPHDHPGNGHGNKQFYQGKTPVRKNDL